MVTHDLKSPVNAEICALELLLNNQKSSLDDFQNEIIGDILGAAKYMKNLVENILQKYRSDNGKQVLHKTLFSLEMLSIQCVEEVKYLLQDKNLDIEIIKRVTLDTYLREKGITSIEELLGTSNSRSSAVAQATELALASGRLRNN